MNELMTSPDKETLMSLYKEFDGSEKYVDVFFEEDSTISIFDHLHFGYRFSSDLYKSRRADDYKKFIRKYNEVTNKEFSSVIKLVDDLFSYIGLHANFLAILTKPKFTIEDKTDVFDGDEFKYEKTLEENMYEFMKFWDESWEVHRQKDVGYGKCDIVLSRNEKTAIELKKGKAERKDVYQAIEYSEGDSGYNSILIARNFSKGAIELAKEYNLNCYEYAIGTVEGLEVPCTFYLLPAYDFVNKTEVDYLFDEVIQCDGFLIEYDVPEPNIAHELTNKELNKYKDGVDLLKGYVEDKPQSNICPHCNTNLSIKE